MRPCPNNLDGHQQSAIGNWQSAIGNGKSAIGNRHSIPDSVRFARDMSATTSDQNPDSATPAATPVPKRITNAQTVCNEKNAKGKLCNGHLKQLRTAGEPSEIHLRGDDVLSKCQTCGTLYMGPPLGHVRDPYKQTRFVEAELSALLQAAGGTLPVIKKDARGVYVMAEAGGHAPAAKPPTAVATTKAAPESPAAQTKSETAAAPTPAPAPKPAAVPKPAAPKAGAEPNRQLFKRSTYGGVKDTGPVPGESFAEKVERLRAVSAAAKQRADEGGDGHTSEAVPEAASAVAETVVSPPATTVAPEVSAAAPEPAAPAPSSPTAHKPTGQADRSLMKRSTYCGVVDTGPVQGETFAQKVERLAKVAAAAKQRAEGG
jgi:hypothetical protein